LGIGHQRPPMLYFRTDLQPRTARAGFLLGSLKNARLADVAGGHRGFFPFTAPLFRRFPAYEASIASPEKSWPSALPPFLVNISWGKSVSPSELLDPERVLIVHDCPGFVVTEQGAKAA
jgi:hypothetical protein